MSDIDFCIIHAFRGESVEASDLFLFDDLKTGEKSCLPFCEDCFFQAAIKDLGTGRFMQKIKDYKEMNND